MNQKEKNIKHYWICLFDMKFSNYFSVCACTCVCVHVGGVCMFVCTCTHVCVFAPIHTCSHACSHVKVREVLGVCPFLPPCRIRRLNSDSRASMQMPLPTDPFHLSSTFLQQKSSLMKYKEKQTRDALSAFICVRFYICSCMFAYIHTYTNTYVKARKM